MDLQLEDISIIFYIPVVIGTFIYLFGNYYTEICSLGDWYMRVILKSQVYRLKYDDKIPIDNSGDEQQKRTPTSG